MMLSTEIAKRVRCALLCACVLAASNCAFAATAAPSASGYPIKPVRFVIPFPPGGGNDVLARTFADRLGERLGQPWVPDNRAGASTIIAAEIVAHAPADGYTLMLATSATLAVLPSLKSKLPYDPVRDFDPISQLSNSPYLLVVHPALPAASVRELIALSNAKAGQINYASPGHGTTNHLAAELFKRCRARLSCTSRTRAPAPRSPMSWVDASRSCSHPPPPHARW
jgi:tripartite-type tricarboxylate transporter receptor subunit TctC